MKISAVVMSRSNEFASVMYAHEVAFWLLSFWLHTVMVSACLVGFDLSLVRVLGKLSENRSVRKLCIGRNLAGIKQRYLYMSRFPVV